MATALLATTAKGGFPELPVALGTANDFVILAETGISTVPTSDITGNMGVSPITSTAITGFSLVMDGSGDFSTSAQVTGKIYAADYLHATPAKMTLAITDMQSAFTDAAGRTLPNTIELNGGDISGLTLHPGLHKWSTGVLINTDVWLDAQGNPDAVFIFQIAGDLTMASAQHVILLGGAQAKNIFWQVAGGVGAVLGTTAHIEGVILTAKAITLQTGATFNGKLLAQARVDLDNNTGLDSSLIVRLEIISEHGTGTPPTGVYFNVSGSLLTNSITASETLGGTQYVNVGWSMIGNDPVAGVTNSMTMVHTNDAVLTWLWSTNYLLNASAVGNGMVTGNANGFYIDGSNVTVTAVPTLGSSFLGWTGDLSGPTNNLTQSMTMDQARTVVAHFTIGSSNVVLEIVSAHGTGTPATGVYFNVYGSLLTNSITPVETMGGTQFVNTGWSMIGNSPDMGNTNLMTMIQTNSAVLTWLWSTNYLLNASAGPGGGVTGSPTGFYVAGSTVVVTATPSLGYQFVGWTGNVSGPTNNAVQTLAMDQARTVVANFSPTFIDVSSQVVWSVEWFCNPCNGLFIGTLTISNVNAQKSLTAPIWFEVQSSPLYRLHNATGFDPHTGMYYIDISTAVASKLLTTGDGDLALDPGESVTVTGIELIGDTMPVGLVMAVWADPPDAVVASHAVGVAFEMPLPVAFAAATKVTVSGLPAGLSYNAATRMITGVPMKPGAFAVAISAAGVPKQTVIIGIGALPIWATGSFNGYIEGGGVASMTVSATGKATGKLAFGGLNYAFTSASYIAGGNADIGFAVDSVAKSGQSTLPLTLHINRAADPAPQTLGVAVGQFSGAPLALYRNVWKEEGEALAPYIGYYTATLPGNKDYGSGYLTFTVDKAGSVKVAGSLADGIAATTGGMLILDDAGRVWTAVSAPYAYKGASLFGIAQFVKPAGEAVYLRPLDGGSLLWQNHSQTATSVYGEGFGRELGLSGGWFDKIGNLNDYYMNRTLSVGTETNAPTPELWVRNIAYESASWDPDGIALTVTTNKSGVLTGIAAPNAGAPVKAGGVWNYDAENPTGLKVTLYRATGVFKGSFKAWFDYAASHTSKNIKFSGILTPERENKGDGVAGRGFFLWADKANHLNPQNKSVQYSFDWSYDLKILLSEPSL